MLHGPVNTAAKVAYNPTGSSCLQRFEPMKDGEEEGEDRENENRHLMAAGYRVHIAQYYHQY